MKPTFSLIHATRGRPEKALAALRMWINRCSNPAAVQYIVCVDKDDDSVRKLNLADECTRGLHSILLVENRYEGSAGAWAWGAKYAQGELLVQMSDDMEPPPLFDALILQAIAKAGIDPRPPGLDPLVVAVSDGFRKDKLLTTFICSDAYVQREGCFISHAYKSVFSDGEATYRAYRREEREEDFVLIEARDIVFLHRHHWHFPKEVPFDKTYADQNAQERYDTGLKTFRERNPESVNDGIVDWL
jgi:hypothetical protein